MENRIIKNPSAEDVATLYSDFGCGKNDIIALSVEDFYDTIKDVAVTVVIENSGSGPERLKLALTDIKTNFAEIAPDLEMSRADKILCLIVATEDFHIKEIDHLTEFFGNFTDDINIIWGVSRNKKDNTDKVMVRILFSYKQHTTIVR